MAANDLYILPTDVQLIPVAELDEKAKEKFQYDEKDYVVTYLHSRNSSRVIDEGAASLLKEFRDPKSLVQGVMNYSVSHQLDPQEILDESYYFLVQLRREGFLVPFSDEDKDRGNYKELWEPGQAFKEYTIVQKIQGLSDTRVFRITDKEGRPFALKVLSTEGKDSQLALHFHNETAVLQHLDGKVNPILVEEGTYNGHSYMILEWCEGLTCPREAEKYRNFSDPQNIHTLLELTGNILEAYAHLHAQGVVHADIHPGNILVAPGNKVKIIDFGLARIEGTPPRNLRGGMGFFFEPEYALAISSGERIPLASYIGEQYALGALLYLMITGKQYLDFSFEKDELFRQIAFDSPIPFSKYDLDLPRGIERTLLQALSKAPQDRYPSLASFAMQWKTLSDQPEKNNPVHSPDSSRQGFSVYTEGLIQKFGWKGKFIEAGMQLPPTCSVNFGAAGIAWMFYRLSCLHASAEYLALADLWANRAAAFPRIGEEAFYSKELDISTQTVGRHSLYHTAAGVHFVQSMISHAMGESQSLGHSLTGFMTAAIQPCEQVDLTLGRSGMLTGCALLWENIPLTDASPQRAELKKTGDQLLHELWAVLDSYPPLQADQTAYFGIAHGWAGFLYATARWCKASGTTVPANFHTRVDQLLGRAVTEGSCMRWPLTNGQGVSWTGWCHGSAGYTFLWTSLYQLTGDPQFVDTAEKTARHFLSAPSPANGSLCCGTAGEVYALLNLYRTTADPAWLKKARQRTEFAQQNIHASSMRANSLYKGDVGLGLLFAEIEQPELARMPVFE